MHASICAPALDGRGGGHYLAARVALTHVETNMTPSAKGKVEAAAVTSGAASPLYCSFCFRSQHEVRTLHSGPASISICGECVDLCHGVAAGRPHNPSSSPDAI